MAKTDSTARPSFFARFAQEHSRVFFFSLGKLAQRPFGTLLTSLVLGVTLALPAALDVLLQNAGSISKSWEGTLQASLYLKDSVSPEQGAALAQRLAARPGVAKARYISREQALAEFRELSGFGEALDTLDSNPLPAVILVTPRREQGKAQIELLVESLGKLPEVELAKLDQKWLERVYAVLDILSRAVLMLSALLAAAVIVIVGNTIRLDIENRREEIVVMKLIGAPNSFIRRPFLYTGIWYGLAGALLALLIVYGALIALSAPAQELARLYDSGFALAWPRLDTVVTMFAGGLLLGWAGAFWTVTRHLGSIEPS